MRAFLVLTVLSFAFTVFSGLERPTRLIMAPQEVFIPQGFDSNDNIEIFFSGTFNNACYKTGLASLHIDEETRDIFISDGAYYYGEDFCTAVLVPYTKQVAAGLIEEGDYQVHFQHSRENFVASGWLPVARAHNFQPDDHLYAPVTGIRYEARTQSKGPYLVLTGQFTNTCMKMREVRIQQRDNSNVVEVLPIAQMLDDQDCKQKPHGIAFEHRTSLDKLRKGRFLFHTRVLNGQSVNQLFVIR